MLAKVSTVSLLGLKPYPVEVEVDTSFGLPQFTIVGLGATAIQEARERVRSAIRNNGYQFPTHRITVNLAPAHLHKDGAQFDLPIAIGILAAAGIIPRQPAESLFFGELSLNGDTRETAGVLSICLGESSYRSIFVPKASCDTLTRLKQKQAIIYPVRDLRTLVNHLQGKRKIEPLSAIPLVAPTVIEYPVDMGEIKGQSLAKRALEVAAAGGHNLLLTGRPGVGKTLLARALPSILPPLTEDEELEVQQIYSLLSLRSNHFTPGARPFRSPHHSVSRSAFIGGGARPQPGEITLAHRGVLFLDELPEFPRQTLEALRVPIEDRAITLNRGSVVLTYPAHFMLIAAQNPCPCGYAGSTAQTCRCSRSEIHRYRQRLSGPLLDRFDMVVELAAVSATDFRALEAGESSAIIRRRIMAARALQYKRLGNSIQNASLSSNNIKQHCVLANDAQALLERAVTTYQLSGRVYQHLVKVALTIADLDQSDMIKSHHMAEAILYRPSQLFNKE